jgi:hypothetical protein
MQQHLQLKGEYISPEISGVICQGFGCRACASEGYSWKCNGFNPANPQDVIYDNTPCQTCYHTYGKH